MRDLGKMGESAFSHWCASAGLTANNSNVDKTGWDFFVEFDYPSQNSLEVSKVHEAAIELRVQVKSTDKCDRKLPVKLSNLKRLATAPAPAFFVFIEFDGKDFPQRVFIVHIDKYFLEKILNRLHDADVSRKNEQLHKMTMTITYDESHMLPTISGQALANRFRSCIGTSLSEYVNKKNHHLSTLGFEKGFAEVTVTTSGIENIKKLINISIGLEDQVDITEMLGFKKRFGKMESIPFVKEKDLKIEMPDLKPNFKGILKLKSAKIGPAFSFNAQLYISPFNHGVPIELRKARIAGKFFNFIFNPFTNECAFTYDFRNENYEIKNLSQSLKFLRTVCMSNHTNYLEFHFDSFPPLKFQVNSTGANFRFSKELETISAGLKLLDCLEIYNPIEISINDLQDYGTRIVEIEKLVNPEVKSFRIDIPNSAQAFPPNQEVAIVSFFATPLGNVWIGVFLVIIAQCSIRKEDIYSFFSTEKIIESTVIHEEEFITNKDELIIEAKRIISKYEESYFVMTRFDYLDL